MKATFKKLLNKVFDVREGEYERALLMQLNFFLVIATLLIVKPAVNGLFLAQLGASKLPSAYLLVALFAILVSSIYARILGRINLSRIILGTLLISVAFFVLFGILLRWNIVDGWILYAFYVVVAIFAVLAVSQFWVLANVVFNVRQAKRIFGFVGAGAIGGGIVGGYITTLLAGPLGSENLIFVAAGILLLCVPNTYIIWKKFVISTQSKYQRRKKIPKIEHPFFLIRKSAHLTNLSAIIALSVIVAKLVDYQFGAITSSIIRDPDKLTAFFGFWFSNFNVISLVIQLIFTQRIVSKIGIGGSLFLLPASIFIGASLVLFLPVLWTAVLLKSSDASLKQSLNRATFELLAVPIPSEIKNQTKIFIDVVVDSLATGAGGLILIFVINGMELSNEFISLIILALLGFWFYFGGRVRKTYLHTFKLNLRNLPKEEVVAINLENRNIISEFRDVLHNGSERQKLSVLHQLKLQPDSRFVHELQLQLQDGSPRIQEQAIRTLHLIQNVDLSKQVTSLLVNDSLEVRIAAFSYLIAKAGRHAPIFIRRYLEIKDYKITLPLLVGLAEESRDNQVLRQRFKLADLLIKEFNDLAGRDLPERKIFSIYLLRAAGLAKIFLLFPHIEHFLADPDLEIRHQAIRAAGDTMDPYFIPALIELLGEDESGEAAVKALVNYGGEIIPAIIRYMKPARVSTEILAMLPKVLEHLPNQLAVDLLFSLADEKDQRINVNSLISILKIRKERPTLNFHRKRCLQSLRTEIEYFRTVVGAEYMLRHALDHSEIREKNVEVNLTLQEMDRVVHSFTLDSLTKSIYWFLLIYPRIKIEDSFDTRLVTDLQKSRVFNQIADLPDYLEKPSLMQMADICQTHRPRRENLSKVGLVTLPDLKASLLIIRQLDDNLTDKMERLLEVRV